MNPDIFGSHQPVSSTNETATATASGWITDISTLLCGVSLPGSVGRFDRDRRFGETGESLRSSLDRAGNGSADLDGCCAGSVLGLGHVGYTSQMVRPG